MRPVPLPVFDAAAGRFARAIELGWQRRDLAALADLPTDGRD